MANLLVFLYLVIGIYYSSCYPLPALAPVVYPKQKEIKPESELRFGYRVIPIPWANASWVEQI